MNDEQAVFDTFKDLYPDYYDILGKQTTQNLVENAMSGNDMRFVTSTKGSSLDIMQIAEQSFVIIQGIAALIQIAVYIKAAGKRPEPQELTQEFKKKHYEIYERISVTEYEKIARRVVSEDDKRSGSEQQQ
jgi:hypothetical protein